MILITVGMVSFRRLMPELIISPSLPFFQLMPVFFFFSSKQVNRTKKKANKQTANKKAR